jgi:hypothetical protein
MNDTHLMGWLGDASNDVEDAAAKESFLTRKTMHSNAIDSQTLSADIVISPWKKPPNPIVSV